jgi:hypothetical protein
LAIATTFLASLFLGSVAGAKVAVAFPLGEVEFLTGFRFSEFVLTVLVDELADIGVDVLVPVVATDFLATVGLATEFLAVATAVDFLGSLPAIPVLMGFAPTAFV